MRLPKYLFCLLVAGGLIAPSQLLATMALDVSCEDFSNSLPVFTTYTCSGVNYGGQIKGYAGYTNSAISFDQLNPPPSGLTGAAFVNLPIGTAANLSYSSGESIVQTNGQGPATTTILYGFEVVVNAPNGPGSFFYEHALDFKITEPDSDPETSVEFQRTLMLYRSSTDTTTLLFDGWGTHNRPNLDLNGDFSFADFSFPPENMAQYASSGNGQIDNVLDDERIWVSGAITVTTNGIGNYDGSNTSTFSISNPTNGLTFTVVAIPEPSGFAFLSLAALGLGACLWCRNKRFAPFNFR